MASDNAPVPEKVGDCWECGGYVATDDDHVFVGSRVFHLGCAERLHSDLGSVL